MDKRWEEHVRGALEVGASWVVGSRGEKLRLLKRGRKASASGEAADQVPDPVVASDHIPCRHTLPGVATTGVEDGSAAGAVAIGLVNRHLEAGLELNDELGRSHGEADRLAGDA